MTEERRCRDEHLHLRYKIRVREAGTLRSAGTPHRTEARNNHNSTTPLHLVSPGTWACATLRQSRTDISGHGEPEAPLCTRSQSVLMCKFSRLCV